ncbi:MAG: PAS domain S-box protein [Pseudomonas sp.]|uniref:hybrid sensor histidine kinase/response regulator n=1 Tax=Pseudomonas sp. TaxID=306 RepID=UPI003399573F
MQDPQPLAAALTDNDRYRVLVEAVIDYAIYMIDPQGIVRSWSTGAKRIKLYEEAEIIGQHFSIFYSPEDRVANLPMKALAIAASEGRFDGEGWRLRKDGTRFWALVVLDPIWAEDGSLIGYAKVTRDLTERKLAQEALRASEQQFRLLVQGVTDYALYMLDRNGIVTTWNAGAQRIKGYEPNEIIGKHFSLFFEPDDAENGAPQRALETVVQDGRFEGQGWRLRKDGSRFMAHVVIDPIREDTGTIIGFAKITRDITDTHLAQAALKEAKEALYQSQKMEALGQLTGGIAHDFNNLLMVILGSLELAKKRLTNQPAVLPLLDNAIAGAQRGASLTQRMLAFARRQELNPQPVDVGTLIRGMSDLLAHSLGPQVAIETRFPLVLQPVLVDASQLEMAILNLAINARDAMPNGGTLVIAAREERISSAPALEDPDIFVCISVTDEGIGMDEATLQRAMEPFFTTKGLGKGTGLGLSMVHGLAQQSGGAFSLKSVLGQGTTGELRLPVSPALNPAMDGDAAPSTRPRASADPARLKILFVDDDPLLLLSGTAMLEDLGHWVLAADGGADALALLPLHPDFDLVITDLAMPGMSGQQLAEQILRLVPGLPVILSSGFTEFATSSTHGLARLPKPYTQKELAQVIARILTPAGIRATP